MSASGQGLPLLFQEKGVIDDKRKKLMPKIVKGKLKGPPDCLLILTTDGSSNADRPECLTSPVDTTCRPPHT